LRSAKESARLAFKSGEDIVSDSSFPDVLAVFKGGTSGWQQHLDPCLKYVQNNISSYNFKVKTKSDFKTHYMKLYGKDPEAGTAGVTNKKTGTILLSEYPEIQRTMNQPPHPSTSYLLAAVHECVHLLSAPVKPGAEQSTAHSILDDGFLEGLVEVIAEDILTGKGIALPSIKSGMRGHQERWLLANELVNDVGVDVLAALLFRGYATGFVQLMQSTYGLNYSKGDSKKLVYVWDKLKIYADLKITNNVPLMMQQSMANAKSRNAPASH
jgi:hypothetical protein